MNDCVRTVSYPSFSAPVAVLGRDLDGTEAIDSDAEDSVDGTETDGVVERQPEITEHWSERPVTNEQIDGVERHWDGTNQQVTDGQRRDEVVGRLTDVTLDDERQNHDGITTDSEHAGDRSQQAEDHYLPDL